jgi:TRAP transporter TatT component family protein
MIRGSRASFLLAGLAASALLCAQTPAPTLSAHECYVLGKTSPDKAARRVHFRAGIAAARGVLERDPNDPDALRWLAANLGAAALERGKMAALKVLPEMERLMLKLDALAPAYDGAAASRVLGVLYSTAPPIISIRSRDKARTAFEKALALAPEHPGNQALAARFFEDDHQEPRAVELARKVLANPRIEDYTDPQEATEWRQIAAHIVEKH